MGIGPQLPLVRSITAALLRSVRFNPCLSILFVTCRFLRQCGSLDNSLEASLPLLDVFLGMENDDVNFGHVEHPERDGRTERHGDGQSGCLDEHLLGGLCGTKEDGYECEPDDAGCVHSEANWFCFVERLWNATTLHGVHRTRYHENDAVAEAADD